MYLIVFILAICLCLSINSYLIGAMKTQIFLACNVVALILVGLSFYFYDWKIGCIAIIAFIGGGIVLKPLGARIAAWLLRKAFQVEGKYIGLPPRRLKNISQKIIINMNRPFSTASLLERRTPEDDLIDYCYSLPKINEILSEHELSKKDVLELYQAIMLYGGAQCVGGHFIAASSLAYPEPLIYFLEHGVTQKTVFDSLMYFERGIPLGILKIHG